MTAEGEDTLGRDVELAAAALRSGELVIYPTETVYGLAADALDTDAVERVFHVKGRARDKPLSMAVPDIRSVDTYTSPSSKERAFMEAFLPGPVTVVLERKPNVPDVLTAGLDRVGIRIPDHDVALVLLEAVSPLTATSANMSGKPASRNIGGIDAEIRDAVSVIIDEGELPGGGSSVVDVANEVIHRRGHRADEVETWLAEYSSP